MAIEVRTGSHSRSRGPFRQARQPELMGIGIVEIDQPCGNCLVFCRRLGMTDSAYSVVLRSAEGIRRCGQPDAVPGLQVVNMLRMSSPGIGAVPETTAGGYDRGPRSRVRRIVGVTVVAIARGLKSAVDMVCARPLVAVACITRAERRRFMGRHAVMLRYGRRHMALVARCCRGPAR